MTDVLSREPTMSEREALVARLRERSRIRRQIPTRKSVQNGEPDRIADLLDEAAAALAAALENDVVGDKVWIGYAQETPSGKLHLMEATCDRDEIHDTGRPLYRLYRDAQPLPPLPKERSE